MEFNEIVKNRLVDHVSFVDIVLNEEFPEPIVKVLHKYLQDYELLLKNLVFYDAVLQTHVKLAKDTDSKDETTEPTGD